MEREELIKKEDVFKTLKPVYLMDPYGGYHKKFVVDMDALNRIPIYQPVQEKTNEKSEAELLNDGDGRYYCSHCGKVAPYTLQRGVRVSWMPHYCSHCGAHFRITEVKSSTADCEKCPYQEPCKKAAGLLPPSMNVCKRAKGMRKIQAQTIGSIYWFVDAVRSKEGIWASSDVSFYHNPNFLVAESPYQVMVYDRGTEMWHAYNNLREFVVDNSDKLNPALVKFNIG